MATRTQSAPRFEPPFCPNPKCKYHRDLTVGWRWKRAGYFHRQQAPQVIPRFTCRCCGRSFSTQTFSTTYWLKRAELPAQILMKAVGGMANRQIARDVRAAPSTIDRLVARIGRHCLLLHAALARDATPAGPVVLDSFESFEWSQFFPFQHHLLVEADTGFFLHFTDSPLRRKGRMTRAQKRRREELERILGRPDPGAVEKDVTHLLQAVLGEVRAVTLRSDDHRAYPRALARLQCAVEHQVTSSRARRDAYNPLFEINLVDLLIRHSQANHRRETLAWSKRRQGSAERLAIFLVWRNYMKRRWEKSERRTPAMLKGLLPAALRVQDVLETRLFRSRVAIPARWDAYYRRAVRTPTIPRNTAHNLVYAF